MGKARKIAGTIADPTLPKTPVVIGGKTYNLCFDLGALAEAEMEINSSILRAGRTDMVNLLFALPGQNLSNTRIMFAASVRKFHPELDFEAALKLLTLDSIYAVATAITDAWKAANPEPEKTADPPRPGA